MTDTLFPQARWTDPDTSHEAAGRMREHAPTIESRILDAFMLRSMTDDTLCRVLNVPERRWPTYKTARSRLSKRGLLMWTGEKRDGQRVWCWIGNMPDVQNVTITGDEL